MVKRLITVDGSVYRWRVRKRPIYPQALTASPLSFAVELADRRGSVLIATMPGAHPGNWAGSSATSLVAAVIRQAREQGWQPDRPGPAFPLAVGRTIWTDTLSNR